MTSKDEAGQETGPVYGVPLLDTLPLGTGNMLQAMPSREDLERVREVSERTVAGFEVLTARYGELQDQVRELLIYKQAMESMAKQFVHPKMTAKELAELQLTAKPKTAILESSR